MSSINELSLLIGSLSEIGRIPLWIHLALVCLVWGWKLTWFWP